MRLLWPHALLGMASGVFGACTLTSDDFHPVRVDSTPAEGTRAGSPASDCTPPCGDPLSPPSALAEPAATAATAAAPRPETSPAASPRETAAPPLPLESANAPSSGSTPADTSTSAADPSPPPAATPEVTAPELPLDPDDLALIGWASVAGLGTETTTGGAAGPTVTATTAEELADFASRPEPLTILVAGTLRLGRVAVASDKTLRGVGPSPRIEGGLRIRGHADEFVRNVIVQNLTIAASFSDVEGDGVQIHYAHHVWVDHCDVQDAPDGNLDIVHGSDFVTVSWSRFSYTAAATSERLSTQIGHSDSATASAEDTGHLRVTLHHDFWDAGVVGSMPSARFGDVHVFNSYYASPEAQTAITAALGSRLLVEDNYFEDVPAPYRIVGGTAPEPELRAVANVVTAAAATLEAAGTAFIPPYEYVPDAAEAVPQRVRSAAGATLLLSAPVP
jgi:pectate lyase